MKRTFCQHKKAAKMRQIPCVVELAGTRIITNHPQDMPEAVRKAGYTWPPKTYERKRKSTHEPERKFEDLY